MKTPPGFGAVPVPGGTRFRVWAPLAGSVEAVIERPERTPLVVPLARRGDGTFEATVPGAGAGTRYRLRLDGAHDFPDPASRFQPEGVHGPSEVVDPSTFAWSDAGWRGVPLARTVLYELHIGTFTSEGTFAAAAARLPELAALGVTAIELMPLADFPGDRNWGYDGAALYAPARVYGRPDDLRRLVDAAHGLGLAVHLDVVYNHFGPDGVYAVAFSPRFLTDRHRTPWGKGVDLDGPDAARVRDFFVDNALHWIHEYHLDGLRLDATHAMHDSSSVHFVAELAERVRASLEGRDVVLVAEDARNLATIVRPRDLGGWGMDGVWSDDFHHEMRAALAGDRDGYFADFTGTSEAIAAAIRRGWTYTGQTAPYWRGPRGTDPAGIPAERFVFFVQNHDQIGNRAFGERLHHQVDLATFRAATAVLLLAPQTPLLFMGQEWAASTPFRFFTDHGESLGALVTAGRREEFAGFAAFSDATARERIPDPQAEATFRASRLDWGERSREPHAAMLRLHQALLAERRAVAEALGAAPVDARALDPDTIAIERGAPGGPQRVVVARLRGAGDVTFGSSEGAAWRTRLTTEDDGFAPDPMPPAIAPAGEGVRIRFARPGAVVLERP